MKGSGVILGNAMYFSKIVGKCFLKLAFRILLNLQTTTFGWTSLRKSTYRHETFGTHITCREFYILFNLLLRSQEMKCGTIMPDIELLK